MTREGALLIMVAVALVLLALGVWAWRRRTQRDASLTAPVGELPAGAVPETTVSGLYVATTRHDEPLERLAVRGLGFRSRVDVIVAGAGSTAGVALDLTGQPRLFIPAARIVSVDQATVAIDRVVEKQGLTRLSWLIDDETIVDSYFRPQTVSARALAAAVQNILTPTQTPGGDA
ncbi:hypothetical protein PUW81_005735 [Microbacterium sp. NM3R9]|uniref:PH-like domain-containing protein n=1 Tax=Microbacterium thalli TaxID=3027921 RepID=UPI00236620DA|nr:hypothetical protein [Microbacterium thalli]MDD7929590.1 hypothetical protein [Microbacterium thalli]MDN8548605.1 hypothetical protein [Microbacterium thalli]